MQQHKAPHVRPTYHLLYMYSTPPEPGLANEGRAGNRNKGKWCEEILRTQRKEKKVSRRVSEIRGWCVRAKCGCVAAAGFFCLLFGGWYSRGRQ